MQVTLDDSFVDEGAGGRASRRAQFSIEDVVVVVGSRRARRLASVVVTTRIRVASTASSIDQPAQQHLDRGPRGCTTISGRQEPAATVVVIYAPSPPPSPPPRRRPRRRRPPPPSPPPPLPGAAVGRPALPRSASDAPSAPPPPPPPTLPPVVIYVEPNQRRARAPVAQRAQPRQRPRKARTDNWQG